jgi:tyrosinase
MKHMLGLLVCVSLQGLAAAATPPTQYTQADIDSGEVLQQLSKTAYDAAMGRLKSTGSGCTKENVHIRKEWHVQTPAFPEPGAPPLY